MPELTVILWRDIPAQVTCGSGRSAARAVLSDRFQEAIDAAAMAAGLSGTDGYLAEWRRDPRTRDGDAAAAVTAEVEHLEVTYTDEMLARLVLGRGFDVEGERVTETILSSPTKEVVLGFDRPFVIIGERINPTGRKQLAAEMAAGNFDTVIADTIAQVEAGAQMLDVNAGIPLADEPGILAHTVQLVQSITDVPLSIDSSIVEALEAGLSVYQGKALVNSVTGEDEQMERVLPLVARHGAAVVAISNDETGISEDPDVRFEVARKIVSRAEDFGIKREDIVVDPLRDADRCDGDRRAPGVPARPEAAGRAPREHDLRRLQRQLRASESNGPQCGVSADGDRIGADERDHEPACTPRCSWP